MTGLTYLEAIILGLVQGLGEFLPISSSGHLALLQYMFGIKGENVLIFAVLLHFGTLISVFAVYRKDIWHLIKELIEVFKDIFQGRGFNINKNSTRRLGFLIVAATLPTVVIGLVFKDVFTSFYGSLISIGIGLVFTGTVLFIAEKMSGGKKSEDRMLFRSAIFVGIMQGIAIAPGVSRSGSTLFGGLITQLDREFAVKFAFLISIPSILGSVILEAPKAVEAGMEGMPLGPILTGMIVAAISGFAAIKVMIRLVSNKRLSLFSYYTWVVGTVAVIYGVLF